MIVLKVVNIGAEVEWSYIAIMARVKNNQLAERALPNIYLRPSFLSTLRFLVCVLALASFISLVYGPLFATQNGQESLPGDPPSNADPDATDLDYVWDSKNKLGTSNETMSPEILLVYASKDLHEKQEKQTINILLEGTKGAIVHLYNKWRHHTTMNSRGRGQNVVIPTWIFQIQNPRYDIHWPRFRQLLLAWSRKKRLDPLAIGDVLGNMKTTFDDFYKIPGNPQGPIANEGFERYRTCAVVGNSGILLNGTKRYGSLIDNHDGVIRLNNAKVRGFEDYVGSKTSVSFVNSNIYKACSLERNCYCHPYGMVPVVLYLCQVHHLMDIAFCEGHYDSPVLVTDPRFDTLCTKLIQWYSLKNYVEITSNPVRSWAKNHSVAEFHYSSGLQAVVLALGICEKVDMFGFGKALHARHHYWQASAEVELSLHDYPAELQFYKDLALNRTSSIPFLAKAGIPLPPLAIYT